MNKMFPMFDFLYKMDFYLEPMFHTHHKYEIYYFHDGKCKYTLGGELIELVPGDFIIMNGMSEHGPIVDKRYTYVRTIVSFDRANLSSMLQSLNSFNILEPFRDLRNYRWRLDGELRTELEAIFEKMNRYYGSADLDPLHYHRLLNTFMELLLFINERSREPLKGHRLIPPEKESTVQAVMSYIEDHYMIDLSLEDLEKDLHFSRFYLMRVFKELTGKTIFEFLNLRRINQAKLLLELDKDSLISDICYQVGFKHPGHFSRNFKRLVGVSPEQYRRRLP